MPTLLLATRRRLITSVLATTQVRSIGPAQQGKWLSRRSLLASSQSPTIPNFAFAFEYVSLSACQIFLLIALSIDGVLLRSSTPLPGATRSLRYLQANGIPFILLTNGGGKTEAQRVSDLSRHLDVPLDVNMFVQSHTPFTQLVDGDEDSPRLKDECILVLGGEGNQCRDVAEGCVWLPSPFLNPASLHITYTLKQK